MIKVLERDARHRISFELNGRAASGYAEPRMLLSDFLRHVVGATGVHVGCEHGVCGACTIRVDGRLARACMMLAVQIEGSVVETVEGGGSVQEAGRSLGQEADGHRDAGHGAGCMALGLACGYGGDHRSHRTEGGGEDEAGGDSEVAQFDDGREPRQASRVSS